MIATFIKNISGHSELQHLTINKEYPIVKIIDRSYVRKRNKNLNDGFIIVNDIGEQKQYFNLKQWKVTKNK